MQTTAIPRTSWRRASLVWVAAIVVVCAIAGAAFNASRQSLAAERWVVHTLEVRATLEHLVSRIASAESAQRAFVLTNDERFLEGHDAAVAAVRADVARLAQLTNDNERQIPRVASLSRIVDAKIAFGGSLIARVRGGEVEAARKAVADRIGDDLMKDLRGVVGEMDAEEGALLTIRRDRAASATRSAYAVAAALIGVSLLVAIVAAFEAVQASRARLVALRRIEESATRFRLLAEAAFEGVLVSDADAAIVDANAVLCEMLGVPRERLIGMTVLSFVDEPERDVAASRLSSDGDHELHLRAAGGVVRLFEVRTRIIRDDERVLRLATLRDITARRAREQASQREFDRVRDLATADALTGLLNRRGFDELAEVELTTARRDGRSYALLFVDLNGMKPINDTFGHEAGDRALVDAATLLTRIARRSDLLARLGGDEFVVFVRDATVEALHAINERIDQEVVTFAREQARPYVLSLSVGWTLATAGDDRSLERLLSDADAAMYAVKRERGASRSQTKLQTRR